MQYSRFVTFLLSATLAMAIVTSSEATQTRPGGGGGSGGGPGVGVASLIDASFTGLSKAQTGADPGDPVLAVGPNHVVHVLNEVITVYNRSGAIVMGPLATQNWFNAPLSEKLTDPQVVWDPHGQRFIALVAKPTGVRMSVSRTSDPTGERCTYDWTMTSKSSEEADWPKLGVNSERITWAADILDDALLFNSSRAVVWSAPRLQLESSGTSCTPQNEVTVYKSPGLSHADSTQAFGLVPVVTHTNTRDQWIVASHRTGGSSLTLFQLSASGQLSGPFTVPTQTYTQKVAPNQPRISTTIETGGVESRTTIVSAVLGPRGDLVVALTSSHDWGNSNIKAVAAWFRINPTTRRVTGQGILGTITDHVFYPAVQEDANGNLLFVVAASGPNTLPSIWTIGVDANDNHEGSFHLLKAGEAPYAPTNEASPVRWGDYFGAALDPLSTGRVWVTGMYAKGANPTTPTDEWGTWIGRIGF